MNAPQPQQHQRHILCMKWGTKYGPEYVNRLYAMVRRPGSGDSSMPAIAGALR